MFGVHAEGLEFGFESKVAGFGHETAVVWRTLYPRGLPQITGAPYAERRRVRRVGRGDGCPICMDSEAGHLDEW